MKETIVGMQSYQSRPDKRLFKGNNFLSPTPVGYYKLGNVYAELAYGKFMTIDLWGCTFQKLVDGKVVNMYDESEPKDTKEDASAYIRKVLLENQ